MISTFVATIEPSQVVTGIAVGGLLVLLIALIIIDREQERRKPIFSLVNAFSIPLFVFFAIAFIVQAIRTATL
jgi:hypothetical protein